MIHIVKQVFAQIKVNGADGKAMNFQGKLVKAKGNTIAFEYNTNEGRGIFIAHPKDIISIRLKTWDNVKKKEGHKKMSLTEYQTHLKKIQ